MGIFSKQKKSRTSLKKEFKRIEPVPVEEDYEQSSEPEIEEIEEEEEIPVRVVKRKEPVWEARQVTIQSEPIVYNKADKKSYSLTEAIVEILNRTED